MRIYTTFGKFITGLQYSSVCDLDTGSVRDQVSLGLSIFGIGNDDFTLLLGILNRSYAAKFCNNCKSLRLTCLKKLLDTDFEKDEAPAEDPEEIQVDETDEIIDDIDETAEDMDTEDAEDTVSVEE